MPAGAELTYNDGDKYPEGLLGFTRGVKREAGTPVPSREAKVKSDSGIGIKVTI